MVARKKFVGLAESDWFENLGDIQVLASCPV